MGGRGRASGAQRNSVFTDAAPITVDGIYREARNWSGAYYKDTIVEAIDKGNGEVELVYAQPDKREKTAKTNRTVYLTYTLEHGFVNDKPHGLNFDNIKAFTGQTFMARGELKDRGYKWDGKNKKWVK